MAKNKNEIPLVCEYVKPQRAFDPSREISITWSIDDIQNMRAELTDDQSMIVLKHAKYNYDCSEGITWGSLESNIELLFPTKEEGVDFIDNGKVREMCQYCETEVELKNVKFIKQICPNCNEVIRACAMCQDADHVQCDECDHSGKGLLNKIVDAVNEKAMKYGIMGTESVNVVLMVSVEEIEELGAESFDLGEHYSWELEGNLLSVTYVEELI